MSIFSITHAYAIVSDEQIEKQKSCYDYKGKDITDNKRLLVNCAEYMYSDYDTVEDYIAEEHPELKIQE